MNYRVSDLKNFIRTADCRTMALAALKMGITAPALSESIQRFESDLGVRLFYRSRSGIQLTPNGKKVLENSRLALSSLLEVESACENNALFKERTITLGCHPVVASYSLPRALKLLLVRAPDFKVHLQHGSSHFLQNLIQMGKLDLGILINPNPMPDLIIKKLATDEVCVWSHGKPASKLICNPEMYQTQAILRKWKNPPSDPIYSESLELIVRLVSSGIGYGILPQTAVDLMKANLHRHTEFPSFKDSICLVYRPEFGKSAFEKELIQALTESLASLFH